MGQEFPFRLRGDDGVIRVSVTRNAEPAREGVNELVDARRAEETDWLETREELVKRYPDWEWRLGWAS